MSDTTSTPPEGFRTRGPDPSGTRLLLIRHGEAVCNRDGIVGGPIGCGGLTDLGVAQSSALRDRLVASRELMSASAIYTSVLPRAIETANVLAPALPDIEPIADCDLCELHPGEGDGLTWDQFVARFGVPDWTADPSTPLAPDAESWLGFYERCNEALTELAERHPGKLVVVVAHGGVIEQAMKMAFACEPAARLRLRTENCSLTEVEFRDSRWHLLRYNDRAPLAPQQ